GARGFVGSFSMGTSTAAIAAGGTRETVAVIRSPAYTPGSASLDRAKRAYLRRFARRCLDMHETGFERARAPRVRRALALAIVLTVVAAVAVQAPAEPHAAANVGAPSWWSGTCDANWWNAQAASHGW